MKNPIPVIPLLSPLALLAGVLSVTAPKAYALKTSYEMAPGNLEESGFSMKVEHQKDGTVVFHLSRDLSKARSHPADSNLEVLRKGILDVSFVAMGDIEPEKEPGAVVYNFAIARGYVPEAHFMVSEIDDYKNRGNQPHLIGGGDIYKFELAKFIQNQSSKAENTNRTSLTSGQYTGVGQHMVIADDGKPRYDDNLNICHLKIEADGSLKTDFPDEETPSRSREMHLQFSENKLRPKLTGPPIVGGTERMRDMWTGSFKGKTYRAVALPFSPDLYVFRLEIIQNEKLIAGEEQFYAICSGKK